MANEGAAVRYHGFISYSHAEDQELARVLQGALHKILQPWHGLSKPKLNVFRDATGLGAASGLTSAITDALGQSSYLLLLASPRAAGSEWVNKEVELFMQTSGAYDEKGQPRVVLVATEGQLQWDAGPR